MSILPKINLNLLDNEEHREAMELNYRKAVFDQLAKIDQKHADDYQYLQDVVLKECNSRGLSVMILAQLPILPEVGVETPTGEHYTGKNYYMFNNASDNVVWVNGKPDRQSRINAAIQNIQFVRTFVSWFLSIFCSQKNDITSFINTLISAYDASCIFSKTGTLPQYIVDSIDKNYESKS